MGMGQRMRGLMLLCVGLVFHCLRYPSLSCSLDSNLKPPAPTRAFAVANDGNSSNVRRIAGGRLSGSTANTCEHLIFGLIAFAWQLLRCTFLACFAKWEAVRANFIILC